MRKPNGYGSVKKLTGNRRRPFVFLVSRNGKQKPLAYFATQTEAEIYAADYNKNIIIKSFLAIRLLLLSCIIVGCRFI